MTGKKRRRDAAGTTLTEADDITKCEDVVKLLKRTVQHAILSHTTLEAANSDERLLSTLNETLEAQAFEVVRFSLMQSLMMQTARCWDHTHGDRASLPHLASLLQKPGLLNALADRAAGSNPSQTEVIRAKLGTLLEAIHEQTSGAQKALRDRVFNYRNYFLAHSLIPKPLTRADDGDVSVLLDTTERLVKAFYSIIVRQDADFVGWRQINAEYARLFWSSFRVGKR